MFLQLVVAWSDAPSWSTCMCRLSSLFQTYCTRLADNTALHLALSVRMYGRELPEVHCTTDMMRIFRGLESGLQSHLH